METNLAQKNSLIKCMWLKIANSWLKIANHKGSRSISIHRLDIIRVFCSIVIITLMVYVYVECVRVCVLTKWRLVVSENIWIWMWWERERCLLVILLKKREHIYSSETPKHNKPWCRNEAWIKDWTSKKVTQHHPQKMIHTKMHTRKSAEENFGWN